MVIHLHKLQGETARCDRWKHTYMLREGDREGSQQDPLVHCKGTHAARRWVESILALEGPA